MFDIIADTGTQVYDARQSPLYFLVQIIIDFSAYIVQIDRNMNYAVNKNRLPNFISLNIYFCNASSEKYDCSNGSNQIFKDQSVSSAYKNRYPVEINIFNDLLI